MCNSQAIVDNFAGRLLALDGGGSDSQYFNLSLRCLYMLVLTGNYWKPGTTNSAVVETKSIPLEFSLFQNFPNPFNSATKISYSIPKSNFATLKIYDVLGREVQTLVNGFQEANRYSIEFNASGLASGVYFYRLKSGNDFTEFKKMVLIR